MYRMFSLGSSMRVINFTISVDDRFRGKSMIVLYRRSFMVRCCNNNLMRIIRARLGQWRLTAAATRSLSSLANNYDLEEPWFLRNQITSFLIFHVYLRH